MNPNFKTYKVQPIVIDGDDLVVDGIELPIKQKLVFAGFSYDQDISEVVNDGGQFMYGVPSGNSLTVRVRVLFFKKNEDGSYGDRVKGGIIPEYEHLLIANGTTLVDNVTGAYLGTTGEEQVPENILEGGKLHDVDFIKESEYFDRIGDVVPIKVRELIAHYIDVNKSKIQPKNRF